MKNTLLTFVAVSIGIVALRGEETQGFATSLSNLCRRCPLATNTASTIHQELRDPVLLNSLLKIEGLRFPNGRFEAIVNGDESNYDLLVFSELGDGAERTKRGGIIQAYVELRWRGVSSEGAIAFLGKKTNAPADKSPLAEALKTEHPWIDPSYLERIQPGDAVSWWPSIEHYIMRDKDIVYLVEAFTAGDGAKTTSVFAMHPSEFAPENRKAFAAAAKAALKKVPKRPDGYPKGILTFWFELKKQLSKAGIKWKTPDELNPDRTATWH